MSDIVQGSDAWRMLRLGKHTASRTDDATARTKTGWSASRANYATELLVERLTQQPTSSFQNADMRHGNETEPAARTRYELDTLSVVTQVPFVEHPTIKMSGASPDGLVGLEGLIEIKCPTTKTHINTLMGEPISGKYMKQIQWQLACTNRNWCDFVSYDDRLPDEMQIFIKRIERNDKMISELSEQIEQFLAEIAARETELRNLYSRKEAA